MKVVVVVAVLLALSSSCVDKEAAAKKKADAQKSFMEAESKARADQEAAEAKEALDDATAGCDGGAPASCIALGKLQKEPVAASASYTKACKLKSKEGCRIAADTETNGPAKLGHLKALCFLEDAEACLQGAALADELVKSGQLKEPPNPNAREPINLLQRACNLGTAVACTAGGMTLFEDDPREAMKMFTKGCDADEPTSCLQLGNMYAEGKGVKKGVKDVAKAKILRKKACDAGLKDAC